MKKMVYEWRTPMFGDLSAQIVGEYLERLRSKEKLTPRAVVSAARAKSSPIHNAFEWNDSKAAEKYRLTQARTLIGSVEVVVETSAAKPQQVRAFVHVTCRTEDDGAEYVPVQSAMADPAMRKQVLNSALSELVSWKVRYQGLKELARIFEAIDAEQLKFTAS